MLNRTVQPLMQTQGISNGEPININTNKFTQNRQIYEQNYQAMSGRTMYEAVGNPLFKISLEK